MCRRMPRFDRPRKHLLGEPSRGPHIVTDKHSLSNAMLLHPATNTLVDGGANVPLDQLLANPLRSKLEFEPDGRSEARNMADMLRPGVARSQGQALGPLERKG